MNGRSRRVEVPRKPTDVSPKLTYGAILAELAVVVEWALSSSFDWKAAAAVAFFAVVGYIKSDARTVG